MILIHQQIRNVWELQEFFVIIWISLLSCLLRLKVKNWRKDCRTHIKKLETWTWQSRKHRERASRMKIKILISKLTCTQSKVRSMFRDAFSCASTWTSDWTSVPRKLFVLLSCRTCTSLAYPACSRCWLASSAFRLAWPIAKVQHSHSQHPLVCWEIKLFIISAPTLRKAFYNSRSTVHAIIFQRLCC